jgi:hypothetical protein
VPVRVPLAIGLEPASFTGASTATCRRVAMPATQRKQVRVLSSAELLSSQAMIMRIFTIRIRD